MNIRIRFLVVVGGLLLASNVSWSAPGFATYTCHISAVETGESPKDCPDNLVPGSLEASARPISTLKFPPSINMRVQTEAGSSFTQKGPSAFAVGTASSHIQGNASASFSYEIQLGVLETYRSFVSNVQIPVFFLATGFAVAGASGPDDANGKSVAESSLIYILPDGASDGSGAIECGGNGINRQVCAESTFHEPNFTIAETIFLGVDETIGVGGEAKIQLVGGIGETGPTELSAFAGVDPNLWIDPEFTVTIDSKEMLATDVFELIFSSGVEYSGVPAEPFLINPGLNDAWFNSATNGQGFLITVFPDIQQIFLAWFTFDTERPPGDVTAMLGEPGHRWLTAQGSFNGNSAILPLFVTSGGVFDSEEPAVETGLVSEGFMTLEFTNCTEGLVKYEINSLDISGEIPIRRIVLDNVPLCETLNEQLRQNQ